jgi:acetone carboxylase gamma subunit
MGMKRRDPNYLIGAKFQLLTVDRLAYRVKSAQYYVCKCKCGNESIVREDNLHMGHTTSCGCLSRNYHQRVIPESDCAVSIEKVCKDCGNKFTVTSDERKWYEDVMGWMIPERCKPCRNIKHSLRFKTA